jgi:putative endonuclease
MKRPCIYILANRRNGTLYIGVTSDLIARIHQHRTDCIEGFTRRYAIHLLVWYEQYEQMRGAIEREKQLKKLERSAKLRLIEKANPEWNDLWLELVGRNETAIHGSGFRHSMPE